MTQFNQNFHQMVHSAAITILCDLIVEELKNDSWDEFVNWVPSAARS